MEILHSRKGLLTAIAVSTIMLTGTAPFTNVVADSGEDVRSPLDNAPNLQSDLDLAIECAKRIPHPPILVDGDEGFEVPGSGILTGSGTEGDPFIIEGWCITAHAWPAGYGGVCIDVSPEEDTCGQFPLIAGIRFLNTNAHVVVRDNVLVPPARILTDQIFEHGHGPPPYQYGITLRGSQNVTIESNYIAHNEWDGIYLFESHNNVMRDNWIVNSRGGINLRTSNHNVIESNQIENMSSNGIFVFGGYSYGATGPSDHNVIRNNTVSTTLFDGIRLWTATNNLVEGNKVRDAHGHRAAWSGCGYERCRTGISITWWSDNNTIKDNEVYENGIGMVIAESSDNRIEGNMVRDSAIYGIATPNGSMRNTFLNNTITSNFLRGISLSPFRDNVLLNNTITNNGGVGIEFYRGSDGGMTFNSNRIYDNGWIPFARNGILLQSSGVVFSSDDMGHGGKAVDLSDNWWGDSTGPSGDIEDACTGEQASGDGAMIRVYDDSLQVCFTPWEGIG